MFWLRAPDKAGHPVRLLVHVNFITSRHHFIENTTSKLEMDKGMTIILVVLEL